MRQISPPSCKATYVYDICINSISDNDLRTRLAGIRSYIEDSEDDYHNHAREQGFHEVSRNDCENHEVVHGGVSKKEMKDVYSAHMVPKRKPARLIYDAILSGAPLGRCPFCGVGYVSTLDHYLPKESFPNLSVVPANLIPCCRDCNSEKGSSWPRNASDQIIHPYYGAREFIVEQWLYARIIDEGRLIVEYYVDPPSSWSPISTERVRRHFTTFKLAHRYAIEANNEIAARKDGFDKYAAKCGFLALSDLLDSQHSTYRRQHVNSWQTALYQELARHAHHTSDLNTIETCPRCTGRGVIASNVCDACNGLGSAMKRHFLALGDSVYRPAPCPKCVAGNPSCILCRGEGMLSWGKAKAFDMDQ